MRSVTKYKRDATLCPLSARERIELKRLCQVARHLDAMNAIPATSSNFSLRASADRFLISRSGIHKRLLEPHHFIRANFDGFAVNAQAPKPSDETLLHAMLYRHLPWAGAIVHCHARELESVRAPEHVFKGHELLKALGKSSHEEPLELPVFMNSQDMEALSLEVESRLFQAGDATLGPAQCVGFVLQEHGAYVVGRSVVEAELRMEALIHLMATQATQARD